MEIHLTRLRRRSGFLRVGRPQPHLLPIVEVSDLKKSD